MYGLYVPVVVLSRYLMRKLPAPYDVIRHREILEIIHNIATSH